VVEILSGHGAEVVKRKRKKDARTEISECVYHELEISCDEVCSFDNKLIEKTLRKKCGV
jgi:hypothetical protein